MIAHCAQEGAPRASKPCRTSSIPSDLAALDQEFWRLWSQFKDATDDELPELHQRVDAVASRLAKAPIESSADAATKLLIGTLRAGWTAESFENEPDDNREKIAAGIIEEVLGYLQTRGEAE